MASTPQTDPAPPILKSNAQTQSSISTGPPGNPLNLPPGVVNFLGKLGIGNSQLAHDPRIDLFFDNWVAAYLKNFGVNWNPAQGTVDGATYDTYVNPGQPIFWVVRSLELFEDFQQFGVDLVHNPVQAVQWFISWQLFDFPLHVQEVASYLGVPYQALYALPAAAAAAPAGSLGGFAGLVSLAALPQPVAAPALAPIAAAPTLLPVAAFAPTVAAPAAAPATAPAPAPAPTASTVASPAPPPAPPAAGGVGFVPPYAVPPGIGSGSPMSTSASSSAKRKAPEPDAAALAAAAAALEAARARRRRRAKQRGYGDEFMDMNIDVDPDWGTPPGEEPVASTVASDQGAGNLGFAGTAAKETAAEAAGLTTLAGDEFGSGPRMPMVPGTWDPDGVREGTEGAHDSEQREES